jgi:hypothetical protein
MGNPGLLRVVAVSRAVFARAESKLAKIGPDFRWSGIDRTPETSQTLAEYVGPAGATGP